MTLSDISLDHFLFFLLGFTIVITWISVKDRKNIKEKYDTLKSVESFSKEEHEKIVKQKDQKISKLESRYNRLKKYMGLVENQEYGVFDTTLTYGDNGEKLGVTAGFKVIQRGQNKVRIDIDVEDVRVDKGIHAKRGSYKSIKHMLDGWYDSNHDNITWVKPNDALKREINIDTLLD